MWTDHGNRGRKIKQDQERKGKKDQKMMDADDWVTIMRSGEEELRAC